jgi:hypothetical protein
MREIAAVVNVGVREDHRVHPGRVVGKVPVAFVRFLAATLKKPALQQQLASINLD